MLPYDMIGDLSRWYSRLEMPGFVYLYDTGGDRAYMKYYGDALDPAELLEYWSFEKQVTDNTPPVFLWQTVTDELVPVENSLLMAASLRAHKVPHALHLFSQGRHGLSLADERWASHQYGDGHCANQLAYLVAAVKSGELPLPEEIRDGLMALSSQADAGADDPSPEVMAWPDLALKWLKKTLCV